VFRLAFKSKRSNSAMHFLSQWLARKLKLERLASRLLNSKGTLLVGKANRNAPPQQISDTTTDGYRAQSQLN
jgi:hypothetical protein